MSLRSYISKWRVYFVPKYLPHKNRKKSQPCFHNFQNTQHCWFCIRQRQHIFFHLHRGQILSITFSYIYLYMMKLIYLCSTNRLLVVLQPDNCVHIHRHWDRDLHSHNHGHFDLIQSHLRIHILIIFFIYFHPSIWRKIFNKIIFGHIRH